MGPLRHNTWRVTYASYLEGDFAMLFRRLVGRYLSVWEPVLFSLDLALCHLGGGGGRRMVPFEGNRGGISVNGGVD